MIKNKPTQGLFSAFYVHFLDRWGDLRHPKYDLSTRKLIYRNDKGIEVERLSFPLQAKCNELPELAMPAH
ncbi:MAG TPA: hypothetical protein VEP67_03425 [Thiobacillaceae bacterium]|nr:hypothetical protein [Thiobacillaceae bacterium]